MIDLTVTIPLKPELFKENRKITWAYSTLNIYKPYITYTSMALICFVIGISTEGSKKYPIGIILGGGFLIYLSFAWIGLIEQWRAFNKITKLHMAQYVTTPQSCTYTFTDEYIMYEDNKQLVKLNWDLLSTYNVYKSTIIIRAKNQKQVLFSIGKYQTDHEAYNQIRSILDEKVG
jgi:hypothetical protein